MSLLQTVEPVDFEQVLVEALVNEGAMEKVSEVLPYSRGFGVDIMQDCNQLTIFMHAL